MLLKCVNKGVDIKKNKTKQNIFNCAHTRIERKMHARMHNQHAQSDTHLPPHHAPCVARFITD